MDSGLEDFLPEYPNPADADFSYQVFRRKEFNDLALQPHEAKPTTQGQLLQDQIFMKRFVSGHTPYDKCLLYRGIGTGKTCVASAIVENFKLMEVDGVKRKPALVFVTSPGLANAFRSEVINTCTEKDTYFATQTDTEQMTERKTKGRLKSSVGASYEMVTYTTFLTVQDDSTADEEGQTRAEKVKAALRGSGANRKPVQITQDLIDYCSNRVIILDESHILRQTKKDEEQMYDTMHLLLHRVSGCRIMLMSGTPIHDDAVEIASQMNLILPADNQLPIGTTFDKRYFDKNGLIKNEDELIEKMRGAYISFIRPMLSVSERRIMGRKKPWNTMTEVWPNIMSELQYNTWKQASVSVENDKNVQAGGAALRSGREASIAVYPKIVDGKVSTTEGRFGTKVFNEYFREVVAKKVVFRFKNNLVKKQFKDNLAVYSTKFADIINDIKAHPNDLIFIYTGQFVSAGAGAILLALCLELHGLKRARTASSIASSNTTDRRFVVFSSAEGTTNKEVDIEAMMKIINDKKNSTGNHCQVVVASEKLSVGYTFKRFTRFHSITPDWNRPTRDQAEGRVFRFGSHDDMPPEMRYVEFFNHVAVKGDVATRKLSSEITTDIRVVQLSDIKERKQVEVYRVMKKVAYDCQLNYNRNVLENDVDDSRECEYKECNYRCEGTPDEQIDTSDTVWKYSVDTVNTETYDAYYSEPEIKRIETQLVSLFSGSHFNLELSVLQSLVDGKMNLVLRALDRIITNRTPITNRYGFISYLKEDGDIYFLDDNFDTGTPYSDSTYTSQLFVSEKLRFDDVAEIERLRDDVEKRLTNVCTAPTKESLMTLSDTTRIVLFETLWAEKRSPQLLELLKSILEADDYLIEMKGKHYHLFTRMAYSNQDKYTPALLTRVFSEKTSQWEYATEDDEERIIAKMKRRKTEKRDSLSSKHSIFGIMKNDTFTIVKSNDGKPIGSGKACTSYSKDDLKEFMEQLDIDQPATDTKNELCKSLLTGMKKANLVSE